MLGLFTKKGGNEVSENLDLKVTALEEIKKTATKVVSISDWSGEGEINVRLRRIDLFNLIEQGKVPNELMGLAHKCATVSPAEFSKITNESADSLKNYFELLTCMAKAALVEPTYDQIVEAAGNLTHTQLSEIWTYCSHGVEILKLFRTRSTAYAQAGNNSKDVRQQAERLPAGDGDMGEVLS